MQAKAIRRRGVNAIEDALPILNALAGIQTGHRRADSPRCPRRRMRRSPLAAQLDISAAHGGTSGGQIPALFEILVNRRYAPEETSRRRGPKSRTRCVPLAVSPVSPSTTHLIGHLVPTSDPTGPHWPRWQRALSAGFGYPPDDFAQMGCGGLLGFRLGTATPACRRCCWAAWAGRKATSRARGTHDASPTSSRWREVSLPISQPNCRPICNPEHSHPRYQGAHPC